MQHKKFVRAERVAELIHKELAGIILKFCQDPRLERLTITNVKLSKDLAFAKIYFTNFTRDSKLTVDFQAAYIKQVAQILNNASSFLRTKLAAELSMRKIPELRFYYDDNMAYGWHMERLLAGL